MAQGSVSNVWIVTTHPAYIIAGVAVGAAAIVFVPEIAPIIGAYLATGGQISSGAGVP